MREAIARRTTLVTPVEQVAERTGLRECGRFLGETPPAGSDSALADCLDSLTDEARSTAFLIDHATFDGQAADVVVAPDPAGATLIDAKVLEIWVLDPDCTLRLQMWLRQP